MPNTDSVIICLMHENGECFDDLEEFPKGNDDDPWRWDSVFFVVVVFFVFFFVVISEVISVLIGTSDISPK